MITYAGLQCGFLGGYIARISRHFPYQLPQRRVLHEMGSIGSNECESITGKRKESLLTQVPDVDGRIPARSSYHS